MIAFSNGVGLIGKYQPSRLSEIVGQPKIAKALRSFLKAQLGGVYLRRPKRRREDGRGLDHRSGVGL